MDQSIWNKKRLDGNDHLLCIYLLSRDFIVFHTSMCTFCKELYANFGKTMKSEIPEHTLFSQSTKVKSTEINGPTV